MATRPKAIIESRNGEKFSPITIAKNVLTDDGQNLHDILSDRKEDMMTPTIENSSSMFKVGQGDNVDYSANVVNGAYESMVLKGKTMVNCIQEPSSQDVVLPYAFEDGQYATINDTKESGALGVELKGQTLVNIHKLNTPSLLAAEQDWYENLTRASGEISFDVLSTPAEWRYINAGYLNYQMLKPNTKYLIVFESSQNISSIHFLRGDGLNGLAPSAVRVQNNKAIITTNSQIVANEQILYVNFYAEPNTKVSFKNPMIIEYQQGMENWDIPYFEGMASCKMPILHTVGKNLFGGELEIGSLSSTGNPVNDDNRKRSKDFFPFKGDVAYVIMNVEQLYFYDENKNFISRSANKTDVSPTNTCFIKVRTTGSTEVQIEKGTVATSYEPHKSSILSLPEEVVLRSLPNSVCDTFNTRTGVYTQRIGELILDGSLDEHWTDYMKELGTTQAFYTSYNMIGKRYDIISNSFPTITKDKIQNSDIEGISSDEGNGRGFVFIRIKKSRLSTQGIDGFKAWLQSNPVTVQYQLETPIITKINLSSTLKSWNTTTHIYSEIPENMLYPILSHSNPSYPVILKPSTKYSIVANSYSNSHSNSPINFNLGGAAASTTVSNRVTTITTPSTLSSELLTMSGRGNKLNNVMVIEGDVVGDEPYFEGICDCKSPILSNVGKNLLPTELSRSFKHITGNQVVSSIDLTSFLNREVQYVIKLAIPKNVKIAKHYSSNSADTESVLVSHGVINSNNTIARFTIPSNSNSYYLFVNESGQSPSDYISDISELVTIELDTGNNPTEIKPYKSNTTTFEQKGDKTIVLRSLPNGVCDTLNVETGEYVQNVIDIVLDGTEKWILNNWGTNDNYCSFEISSLDNPKIQNVYKQNSYIDFYCDTFKVVTRCAWNYMDEKHIRQWSDGNRTTISVIIPKTELKTYNVAGFIEYLTKNNIRINIRVNKPIVSTIDIQGFPYAYTNGHVQLSSDSIEQSLTPKVEYSVATNRNGQIRSNQKMVERHQKQLDRLQAMILTNLVNTQYEQTLTNLKYDLKNVREEVK